MIYDLCIYLLSDRGFRQFLKSYEDLILTRRLCAQKLQEYFSHPQRSRQAAPLTPTNLGRPLLPAIELENDRTRDWIVTPIADRHEAEVSQPCEIERPRSALHAGDFTKHVRTSAVEQHSFSRPNVAREFTTQEPLATSPTTPWYRPSSRIQPDYQVDPRFPAAQDIPVGISEGPLQGRAPSLQSYSSSYILKPPTSPLVQQSNNDDLDFSPVNLSQSPTMSNRRFTLPSQLSQSRGSPSNDYGSKQSSLTRQPISLRREGTFPYQSHHPRRSLTTNWSVQSVISPQTPPFLRSRRPSFSSEASPLQHAAMVGSYEESILRGRMSTNPSKPLDFTAQIGVLGKGDCKPKYPAHVTVPFPAVYYSWNNGIGRNLSKVDDEPSPYVGHIDLEHSLPPHQVKEKRRRYRGTPRTGDSDASGKESTHEHDCVAMNLAMRKREKHRRRSPSPKAPIGGSYRIPQQGQLQIMIKNPNKTAVKLFLVPYDLTDMEAGTKTFIRQRCYSTGPIIEPPLTSRFVSEPALDGIPITKDAKYKPSLRYLIHLNICCPSKGRFYLYQHIRVVFANRVPDSKENLRNEIQLPEPRYSHYKANRDSLLAASSAGAKLTAEKAQRRRSYAFGAPLGSDNFNSIDDVHPRLFGGSTSYPREIAETTPPVPSIPFHLTHPHKEPSKAEDVGGSDDVMDLDSSRPTTSSGFQSPLSDKTNRLVSTLFSSSFRSSGSNGSDGYNKLSKGDAGYGGVFGRPGTPEPGEGLLARRLRGLGMEKEPRNMEADM